MSSTNQQPNKADTTILQFMSSVAVGTRWLPSDLKKVGAVLEGKVRSTTMEVPELVPNYATIITLYMIDQAMKKDTGTTICVYDNRSVLERHIRKGIAGSKIFNHLRIDLRDKSILLHDINDNDQYEGEPKCRAYVDILFGSSAMKKRNASFVIVDDRIDNRDQIYAHAQQQLVGTSPLTVESKRSKLFYGTLCTNANGFTLSRA